MKSTIAANKVYEVPAFLYWALVPSAYTLLAVLVASPVLCLIFGIQDDNYVMQFFPAPIQVLFEIWGIYAGLGTTFIWLVMLNYWLTSDRRSPAARGGWFFPLFLGMQIGGVVYALYLWKIGVIKTGEGRVAGGPGPHRAK